jgi:hypothetical protein
MSVRLDHEAYRTYETTNERSGNVIFNKCPARCTCGNRLQYVPASVINTDNKHKQQISSPTPSLIWAEYLGASFPSQVRTKPNSERDTLPWGISAWSVGGLIANVLPPFKLVMMYLIPIYQALHMSNGGALRIMRLVSDPATCSSAMEM